VTSSLAVFETVIRVKSTHRIKSCLKTRKEKYGNKGHFFHKAPSKKIVFEWNSQLSKAS